MKPLTPRQAEIYDFIVDTIRLECRPPSLQQIVERFDLCAPSSAQYFVLVLVRKGWLKKSGGSRSIRPSQPQIAIKADGDKLTVSTDGQVTISKHDLIQLIADSCGQTAEVKP
jgi:SOS-response transcriptional repressor LexA